MNIFTPNMLNTYCECPSKYYYSYVKNIKAPQNDSPYVVGKNIHALASYYLKGEDISKYDLEEKESALWKNLVKIDYLNMEAIKIEQNIVSRVGDYWIGGRVDAVVKDKNENYYILDYKTGSIPKNYETAPQTMIYSLCCDKLYNNVSFVYINVRESETRRVILTDELRQEYKSKVLEIIHNIQKDSFTRIKRTENCAKCLYNKVCI